MAGERYVVELDFKRVGDLGIGALDGKISGTAKKVDGLKRSWSEVGQSVAPLNSALDTMGRATASVLTKASLAGGAAVFAGATYGVVNLNNELEKAQISLGTIFSAQGMAANVPAGIERAKTLIGDMRRDAQKLPGEFEDLMRIFTTGAIPAFHSGASVNQWRELSSKAMAAGKVANMDLHQVAREMTLLLEGRAGSQNTFGTKLGIKADGFNSKSSEERLKILATELDKYTGAIAQFEGSYDAQSSTLIDNLKNFGRIATSSLFIHVKDAMKDANAWFASHQEEAERFAAKWGSRLVEGFEAGKRAAQEWGPVLFRFGENLYDRVTGAWADASPYVEKFGDMVKRALEDPNGTIDKLIELAKLWAGMKIGTSLVGGLASGGRKGGMINGGAALGAYGVGNSALNGVSAQSYVETVGGGALIGSGMGGPLGAGIGALAGATIANYQMMSQAADKEAAWREGIAQQAESYMATERRWFAAHGFTQAEAEQSMQAYALKLQTAAMEVDPAAGAVIGSIYNLAAGIETASYSLLNRADKEVAEIGSYWGDMMRLNTQNAQAKRDAVAGDVSKAASHKSKGGGGGSIQKVEIVVTSNQHPNRIARAVVGELGRMQRMSGNSQHVENYSALDDS